MFILDHFQQSFRSFRSLSPHRLIRLPSVLDIRERLALLGGIVAIVVGIALTGTGWYRERTAVQPAVGGTYVEGLLGEPRFVNPLFASANDVDADLVRLLYAGLFRFDENGAVVPDLAERHEVASDGKSVTITLRDGIRWHDGANLTADDVVFTIHLIQDAAAGSPLRSAFRGVTVERVDERTVKFTIDRPLAVFLSALTVGILPQHLWVDIPPAHLPLAEFNLRPIGAGPYRFVGLTKDRRGSVRSYTLERYVGIHRAPPLLERLTFRFYPDNDQLIAALNSREIDGIGTLSPIPPNAITRRDVTRYAVRLPSTTAVFFNEKRAPALRELAVRRALSLAVDRRMLVMSVLNGDGEPIGGPNIPGFFGVADPPPPDAFDVEQAAVLLDGAKWTRLEPDVFIATRTSAELRRIEEEKKKAGKKKAELTATEEERATIEARVREELVPEQPYYRMSAKGGSASGGKDAVLSITITAPDVPEFSTMAELIQRQWRAIGVHTRVDTVPLERIRGEVIPNRAYDTLLFSQILGPDPDPFPFWHSSQVRHPGLNLSYFSNRAIDKILEDARGTLDREARGKKYAEFQKALLEERPAVFLTTPVLTYAMSSAVRGVRVAELAQPADRFARIHEWYTETERVWNRD